MDCVIHRQAKHDGRCDAFASAQVPPEGHFDQAEQRPHHKGNGENGEERHLQIRSRGEEHRKRHWEADGEADEDALDQLCLGNHPCERTTHVRQAGLQGGRRSRAKVIDKIDELVVDWSHDVVWLSDQQCRLERNANILDTPVQPAHVLGMPAPRTLQPGLELCGERVAHRQRRPHGVGKILEKATNRAGQYQCMWWPHASLLAASCCAQRHAQPKEGVLGDRIREVECMIKHDITTVPVRDPAIEVDFPQVLEPQIEPA
mmetsp:Transcript_42042/g.123067  ORF Transcript_42042/g.123067 Transcript_42042/m.123067 type:complete len:260 (+) Transcript_42042:648-1427(+)